MYVMFYTENAKIKDYHSWNRNANSNGDCVRIFGIAIQY